MQMQITTEKAIQWTEISSNIDQIETYLGNKIRGETCWLGALVVVKPEHKSKRDQRFYTSQRGSSTSFTIKCNSPE